MIGIGGILEYYYLAMKSLFAFKLIEPCKLLASYYSENFKYKLSSKYYFLALLCMEKELRR
jgi:hypothetical protein